MRSATTSTVCRNKSVGQEDHQIQFFELLARTALLLRGAGGHEFPAHSRDFSMPLPSSTLFGARRWFVRSAPQSCFRLRALSPTNGSRDIAVRNSAEGHKGRRSRDLVPLTGIEPVFRP